MLFPKLSKLTTHLHNDMILNGTIATIGSESFAVYTVIALFADWNTGWSHPSIKTIQTLTGIKDHRTVRKYITRLVEHNLLSVEFRQPVNKSGLPYGRERYFYKLTQPAIKYGGNSCTP